MNLKFWNKMRLCDDFKAQDRATFCLAEFFGMAILTFVGCMGCVPPANGVRSMVDIAFSFGLAYAMALQCFGHISGAHVNPILTVGAFLTGTLALVEVPVYFIGQFAGSFLGYGLVTALMPKSSIFYGADEAKPKPPVCCDGLGDHIQTWQGLLVEISISFILVTVSCAVRDVRNSEKADTVSLRFGLVYGVISLAAGPITGAHMNPARTLAPAVINNFWDKNQWIFWVGPIVGSVFASILYNILYGKDEDKEEAEIADLS